MPECDEMYEKTSSHVPVLEKGCCPDYRGSALCSAPGWPFRASKEAFC